MAWQGTTAPAAASCASLSRIVQVLESEHEMDTSRILSVGVSLAGGGVLEVSRVVLRTLATRTDDAPCFPAARPLPAGTEEHPRTQHHGDGRVEVIAFARVSAYCPFGLRRDVACAVRGSSGHGCLG